MFNYLMFSFFILTERDLIDKEFSKLEVIISESKLTFIYL